GVSRSTAPSGTLPSISNEAAKSPRLSLELVAIDTWPRGTVAPAAGAMICTVGAAVSPPQGDPSLETRIETCGDQPSLSHRSKACAWRVCDPDDGKSCSSSYGY